MFDGLLRQRGKKDKRFWQTFFAIFLRLLAVIPFIILGNAYWNLMESRYWGGNHANIIPMVSDAAHLTIQSARVMFDNEPLPQNNALPAIRLQIQPGSLERMISNLPTSIKEKYYSAKMLYPDGTWQRVEYRLRGRNTWHWQIHKPSLRIKLRKQAPIDLQRRLNLVNPEDRAMVSNVLSEAVGASLGVLTHRTQFTRLYLNNEYFGVYHLSTQDDESWLRLKHRMPGPIFIGERLGDKWQAWQFDKKGDLDALAQARPMERMTAALYRPKSSMQVNELWQVLSIEQTARWMAALAVTGSLHADYSHNQLFYFDPTTGLLEPAMADVNGYDFVPDTASNWHPLADIPLNGLTHPLSDVALRDPFFRHKRNTELFKAINGAASAEAQLKQLEEYFRLIDPHAIADRRKGALLAARAGWYRFPYDNRQYAAAKQQMQTWIIERERYLRAELEATTVSVTVLSKVDAHSAQVVIDVTGHSAVNFSAAQISGRLMHDRDGDADTETSTPKSILLHPGISLHNGDYHSRIPVKALWPAHMIHPGRERYVFSVQDTAGELKHQLAAAFTNAVTGASITPQISDRASTVDRTWRNSESIHPWSMAPEPKGEIRLGPGIVRVTEDIIIGADQSLFIAPGTNLFLGPGASIVSKGRITLAGTPSAPINIKRLNPSEPWGAIVIHSSSSSGSSIRHAQITGGSRTEALNVRYSGMLSVHWSDNFTLGNSRLSANVLSDDALHIVSGNFELTDIDFSDCFADCIDLDYATGSIAGLTVNNSRNDGLDLMASNVTLRRSKIRSSGDKAISSGEQSKLSVTDSVMENSQIGIAVKDRSSIELLKVTLTNNQTAIDVYRKNWRFGSPGSIRVKETKFVSNTINARVEEGGSISFLDSARPERVVGGGEVEVIAPQTGS